MEKYEFGSRAWIAELRRIVEAGLAGKDLTGLSYTLSEKFTNPPAHLCADDTSIGWSLTITDGKVEVHDQPLGEADFCFVGDYSTVLALARVVRADDPDRAAEADQAVADAIADGRFRHHTTDREMPAVIAELDLHDAIAIKTA